MSQLPGDWDHPLGWSVVTGGGLASHLSSQQRSVLTRLDHRLVFISASASAQVSESRGNIALSISLNV